MHADVRTNGGVPGLPTLDWGSHICHFYEDASDLADTLVPYFKAGIDADEACLWVTSEPFATEHARAALRAHVPDLAAREQSGQMEIVAHDEWYERQGKGDAQTTLNSWVQREQQALQSGFRGLRLTGNTYWLERQDWPSFVEYERLVNHVFHEHRIVAMCSYCFARCSARDVLDVLSNHHFALARYGTQWQVVESSAMPLARTDLMRLNTAAEQLRDHDRRKDEFMAILSHELRNPLAPIRTAAQLMRMRGGSESFDRELTVVDRQVRHLTRLVDDLLDVSRITRGKVELRREPAELSELVARAAEMVMHLVEQRGHRLELDVPRGIILNVDSDRIVQALGNLLTNAARYTPHAGVISVLAKCDEEQVILSVSDNGPGIPLALQQLVFEPFVQGDRPLDRPEGGLGLGLPIVKSLTELHGGELRLTSDQAGTVITLQLPLTQAPKHPVSQKLETPTRSSARILLVDDNEDAADMLGELLSSFGYDVVIANDGIKALQLAAASKPVLAILDIGLPLMDGYELAGRLRQLPELSSVPLIALTGYSGTAERALSAQAGFSQHLAKPVDFTALRQAITKLLQPQAADEQASI